jgi:hypothetical protein
MKTSVILSVIVVVCTLNLNATNIRNDPMKELDSTAIAKLLASLEVVEEQVPEISAWMFDVDAFQEAYKMLKIEDWMLDPEVFENCEFSEDTLVLDEGIFTEYEEEVLPIEDWMFDF